MSASDDPGRAPDLRHLVPDLIPYLRPQEKVIDVRPASVPSFSRLPSYREELAKLCGVDRPSEIGRNGPAMASRMVRPAEGQGLFECRFGRDGLIAAMDLMDEFPELMRAMLLDYASLIGMREDERSEEEFGRMFHEARAADDPIALSITEKRGWGWPYYGSVDATPLFVIAVCLYCHRSPEGADFLRTPCRTRSGVEFSMGEALLFAVTWIAERMKRNPERFLEYRPGFPGSIENQIMEDSWDSRFHADGRLPSWERGLVSTDVQGLACDALVMAAPFVENLGGDWVTPGECYDLADRLAESVFRHLWVDDPRGGYFAVGAERGVCGEVMPMRVLKASSFALLTSSMLRRSDRRAERFVRQMVRTLFSPRLIAEGGVRSLATGEPRFMPGAYHNGSVWPMQTYAIARGLRAHGFQALAEDLEERLMLSVELTCMFPEYVRGGESRDLEVNRRIVRTYDVRDGRENVREQPPQAVQLWTLSAYAAVHYRRSREAPAHIPRDRFEEEVLSAIPA